jgi:hypothetical protein
MNDIDIVSKVTYSEDKGFAYLKATDLNINIHNDSEVWDKSVDHVTNSLAGYEEYKFEWDFDGSARQTWATKEKIKSLLKS